MVLHVRVVSGSGGGPDKTILRSARYVDPRGLRMAAAYIHPRHDPGFETIRAHARRWNCPLHGIGESGPVDPRTVSRLLRLCRDQRVAVWHGHDYKSNLLGLLLRPFWPMKLVTTAHGWTRETRRTKVYYHVDLFCLPRYDRVIAVSPAIREQCLARGVREDRLTYVPNAIELSDYPFRRAGKPDRMEPDSSALRIGVVGRLSVEKGVDRALRATAALRRRYPNVQLHLVGDGPEDTALRALAVDLGIAGDVRFHGWQEDARPQFSRMDMLLLPSHTEGLPNVVLEAMAMGVPVAATNVGGVSELLDEGRCGVILDPIDEASWPDHIAPLLVSADRRAALARLARERVEQHYSFARRMARVTSVYRESLGLPRPVEAQRRAA